MDNPTSGQIQKALRRRLLGRTNPEDPNRCELHRFILSKMTRFQCPEKAGDWKRTARSLRRQFLKDVYK